MAKVSRRYSLECDMGDLATLRLGVLPDGEPVACLSRIGAKGHE